MGNLAGQEEPSPAVSITHTYDAYGRQTDSTWGMMGGAQKHDSWTYDVLGRMTSYTNSIRTPNVETDTYEYDSRGRMTKHTGHDPDGLGTMYTGAPEYFAYNGAGQPSSHTDFLWTGGQPTLRSYEMICLYLQGWAELDEVMEHLAKLQPATA